MQGYKVKEKTAIVPPVSKLSGHPESILNDTEVRKIYRLEETKVAGPSGPTVNILAMGSPPYASSGSLSTYFDTDRV